MPQLGKYEAAVSVLEDLGYATPRHATYATYATPPSTPSTLTQLTPTALYSLSIGLY
jgi:hypothetical protein